MKYLLIMALAAMPAPLLADALEEGRIYQLEASTYGLEPNGNGEHASHAGESIQPGLFKAPRDFKFKVHDASSEDHYLVRFVKTYPANADGDEDPDAKAPPASAAGAGAANGGAGGGPGEMASVVEGELYRLPRGESNPALEKTVSLSHSGLVSGPLIVPFKYRLDDESLGGDATIGFYAGYTLEPRIHRNGLTLPVTPFISGGLSQVAVTEGDETSSQTGMTVAVGLLFPNWDGVAIGVVAGQDRIGDADWEHEGENWLSFMIGWKL